MNNQSNPLIAALDSKRALDVEHAWLVLREQGSSLMPCFLHAYPHFKTARGRVALVFYATRFARDNKDAFELGVMALKDKSKLVRDRACALLADSLHVRALPYFSEALADIDLSVRKSALAAIKAVKAQNHHLFADRTGSGNIQWIVDPEDRLPPP